MSSRASPSSSSPRSAGRAPAWSRSSRRPPSCFSRVWMICDSDEWLMCRRRAAAEKPASSATATNTRKSRISIEPPGSAASASIAAAAETGSSEAPVAPAEHVLHDGQVIAVTCRLNFGGEQSDTFGMKAVGGGPILPSGCAFDAGFVPPSLFGQASDDVVLAPELVDRFETVPDIGIAANQREGLAFPGPADEYRDVSHRWRCEISQPTFDAGQSLGE